MPLPLRSWRKRSTLAGGSSDALRARLLAHLAGELPDHDRGAVESAPRRRGRRAGAYRPTNADGLADALFVLVGEAEGTNAELPEVLRLADELVAVASSLDDFRLGMALGWRWSWRLRGGQLSDDDAECRHGH